MGLLETILAALADQTRQTGLVSPVLWIGLHREDHAAMLRALPAPLTEDLVRPGHPYFSGAAIWAHPGDGASRFLRTDGEAFMILPNGDGSYRVEQIVDN